MIGPEEQGIAPGEFQELVKAIRRNAAYVNVHTEAFPTGEVRGNVIPS
ncbi:MAG: CHRD domain-containing protein [Actinomycetota bacterium]